MKKTMIMLLSAMTMTTAMADYRVTIGQGIPKESIRFVDKTPPKPELPPEPPKVPECAPFNYGGSYSFWQDDAATPTSDPYYGSMVYWKGTRVAQNAMGTYQPKVNNFEAGGYRYYSDGKLGQSLKYSNTSYSGYFYGICRVPL
jgi:hypothetical protein